MTEAGSKVYRKLSRNLAVSIIQEMAKSDTSIGDIARKTNMSHEEIAGKLIYLIDGTIFIESLHFLSDVLLAMGAELEWNIKHKDVS